MPSELHTANVKMRSVWIPVIIETGSVCKADEALIPTPLVIKSAE